MAPNFAVILEKMHEYQKKFASIFRRLCSNTMVFAVNCGFLNSHIPKKIMSYTGLTKQEITPL